MNWTTQEQTVCLYFIVHVTEMIFYECYNVKLSLCRKIWRKKDKLNSIFFDASFCDCSRIFNKKLIAFGPFKSNQINGTIELETQYFLKKRRIKRINGMHGYMYYKET